MCQDKACSIFTPAATFSRLSRGTGIEQPFELMTSNSTRSRRVAPLGPIGAGIGSILPEPAHDGVGGCRSKNCIYANLVHLGTDLHRRVESHLPCDLQARGDIPHSALTGTMGLLEDARLNRVYQTSSNEPPGRV